MDQLGIWVLIGTLVLATVFGLYRRRTDGRIRGAKDSQSSSLQTLIATGQDSPAALHIVQFSSEVCAQCRAAERIITPLADGRESVSYHQVKVEKHPELVSSLNIMRTPTIIVADSQGAITHRITGVPKTSELRQLLDSTASAGLPAASGAEPT